MSGLEPITTVHAKTGAFRTITSNLLAETYLAPQPVVSNLNTALSVEGQPWTASMVVAPIETAQAVSLALRSLAMATKDLSPDEVSLFGLDQDSRLYRHLAALRDLWRQSPGLLSEDLQVYAHVLNSSAADVLEPLALVTTAPCTFASPIERSLYNHLLGHHGLASEALRQEWEARKTPLLTGAPKGTSLWHAQQGLTGADIAPSSLDGSLGFFALRDEAEEADFAAARVQKLIDDGAAPEEIAILLPDEVGYFSQLHRAFDAMGVLISGLPDLPTRRDIAGETLLHLLLCLQSPAPAMALASLYISPLMPWPAATGQQLAREVMQGRFDPYVAKSLTGRARRLYDILRRNISQTPHGIVEALDIIRQNFSDNLELREDILAFDSRLATLRGVLSLGDTLDWNALYRIASSVTAKPVASEMFVEGVSVFTESTMPWRPARHLIALGMSGNRWPRSVSTTPLFLDGELLLLREKTGLCIETRADALARRLEKMRRQFLCCSETLTLLRSSYSANGSPQPPAAALSLVARTIRKEEKVSDDEESLVREVYSIPKDQWPFTHYVIETKCDANRRIVPDDGLLRLDRDLLRGRLAKDGRMRPQSPSKLETLLVSPLAWSLSEFRAEPVTWAPEGLNVMVAGTISHDVLEYLFPKDEPLPDHDQIQDAVPELLFAAIRKYAPFLQRSTWSVEREGLVRDIRNAAHVWRDRLEELGARVIDNEIDLHGEAFNILLRGRADCLLQLPDDSLLVVDHKKSGTARRRARLDAGWDLQLWLYRAMLMRPEKTEPVLEAVLAQKPAIGVAYHLINDQGVLLEGLEPPDGVVNVMHGDISGQAINMLKKRLAEVSQGLIRLNNEDDRKFFENTAKLAPYALDASPLVSCFMVPASTKKERLEGNDD